MKYDYVIAGAGLFGATFARIMTDMGKSCMIFEKNHDVGGNCIDIPVGGIRIHRYGPHIFHTSSKKIWKFVNQFAEFNQYKHKVMASLGGKLVPLPINLETINRIYGANFSPEQARIFMAGQINTIPTNNNFEEVAINRFGLPIYDSLIRPYTEKHWGLPAVSLDGSIAKRIPIRYNYDDNYYRESEPYQGLPVNGYSSLFTNLLDGIKVECGEYIGVDSWHKYGKMFVYSGGLDELFKFEYGPLPYRSATFVAERYPVADYQGCAQINHPGPETKYTRTVEYKHMATATNNMTNQTVVVREYPVDYTNQVIHPQLYPIPSSANTAMHNKYKKLVSKNIIVGGRLGSYRYMDMDQTIGSAMEVAYGCSNISL